jgi:uncharacterized protein (TIGR02186 family)
MTPDVSPPSSAAPAISAALTEPRVRIGSDFRGARIVLYGAVFDPRARPADVVVVVRGPDRPVRIARKVRVAGAWLNAPPAVFNNAPGFYIAASSRALDDVLPPAALRRLGGAEALSMRADCGRACDRGAGAALVRLQAKAGLYALDGRGVTFVDDGLFSAEVRLPPNAPVGRYRVMVALVEDGRIAASRALALDVRKAGGPRLVSDLARTPPWLYGFLSTLLSLGAGGVLSLLSRR